jgi:hypothetical protein
MAAEALRMKIMFRWCTEKRYGAWTLRCAKELPVEQFYSACEGALTLLHQHDSRRYKRLESVIKNIVLSSVTSENFFEPATLSCVIKSYSPDRTDSLALAFVHESTHAYLFSRGLRYSNDPRRHEALCVKEEFRSIKRMSMTRWPGLSNENREKWLKQWADYFEAEMKSEWWELHQRDRAAIETITKLLAE